MRQVCSTRMERSSTCARTSAGTTPSTRSWGVHCALPASSSILVVSGRAGYEIVQKAISAGIPVLAAVGAPSSLAVALAREFNLTLVGFLRGDRYNVYAGPDRLTAL